MTTNERANLTDNAWIRRIDELRTDLENQFSAIECNSYVEAAEWMLSENNAEAEYDLDDAEFLRRDAKRQDDLYIRETTVSSRAGSDYATVSTRMVQK